MNIHNMQVNPRDWKNDFNLLLEDVEKRSKYNWDFESFINNENININYDDQNIFFNSLNGKFKVNDNGLKGLSRELDVPYGFLKKHPLDFQSMLLNELIIRNKYKNKRLIRTYNGELRAVLSDKYSIFDNIDALMLLSKLNNLKDMSYSNYFEADNSHLLITMIFHTEDKKELDSIYQYGLSISNSEIGDNAFQVAGFINRLVCTNGMVVSKDIYRTRKVHFGANQFDDINILSSTILENLNIFNTKYQQTKNKMIEKPSEYLEILNSRYNINKSFTNNVKATLISEEIGISEIDPEQIEVWELKAVPLFNVVNAFTHSAKYYQEPHRTNYESIASNLIINEK